MKPDLSTFLKQAQIAVEQKNWSSLTQCLQQLVGSDRAEVLQASSRQDDPDFAQVLGLALAGLAATDFQERWRLAKLIPQLGKAATSQVQSQGVASLIAILQDDTADLELRWFVARILGEFDQPEVVSALVELLQTSEDEDLTAVAAEVLAKLGPSAVSVLTDLLAEERTRLLAVRSLSQIRSVSTIAPLLTVVHDPQAAVRATAIEAVGSFHHPQVITVLIEALADRAAPVRRAAVFSLSFRPDLLKQWDLVTLIQPLLADLNLDICQQAAIALGRLGTEAAAAALFHALQSPLTPVPVQITILRALSRIETSQSLAYLRQALGFESTPVVQETVTVLGRLEQPQLRSQVAQTLIDLVGSERPALQDPMVKQSIALSLGQLEEISAMEALIELLADADAGVRLHAIAALKKLAPDAAYCRLKHLEKDQSLASELQHGVAIALQEW